MLNRIPVYDSNRVTWLLGIKKTQLEWVNCRANQTPIYKFLDNALAGVVVLK